MTIPLSCFLQDAAWWTLHTELKSKFVSASWVLLHPLIDSSIPPRPNLTLLLFTLYSSEPTVYLYDEAANTPPSKTKKVTGKAVPPMPANLAAAKKQLEEKQSVDEEDRYVYLPPGSSMRDPGYNSMSDPLDKRVYYRDPVPSTKKK